MGTSFSRPSRSWGSRAGHGQDLALGGGLDQLLREGSLDADHEDVLVEAFAQEGHDPPGDGVASGQHEAVDVGPPLRKESFDGEGEELEVDGVAQHLRAPTAAGLALDALHVHGGVACLVEGLLQTRGQVAPAANGGRSDPACRGSRRTPAPWAGSSARWCRLRSLPCMLSASTKSATFFAAMDSS